MRLDKDNKAWNILTDEEKTALSLQFSFEKSTWQAGEIMGKAHYKYLEIKARAEKFLKMFTEHFEIFQNLIPIGLDLDGIFKDYIIRVIIKRENTFAAISSIKNKDFSLTTYRDSLINAEFKKLQDNKDYGAQALVNILLDFDRWNNFRILPKNLQEPSAYKRRNKNRLKKQIKTIVNINPFVLEKVIDRLGIKKPCKAVYNLPLLLDKGKSYKIIQLDSGNENNIEQVNKLGLFLFANYDKAKEFSELLVLFNINSPKDCKQGLQFWPQYRLLIQGAINYGKVENIIPTRKYLDNLTSDWDIKKVRNIKKNKSTM